MPVESESPSFSKEYARRTCVFQAFVEGSEGGSARVVLSVVLYVTARNGWNA